MYVCRQLNQLFGHQVLLLYSNSSLLSRSNINYNSTGVSFGVPLLISKFRTIISSGLSTLLKMMCGVKNTLDKLVLHVTCMHICMYVYSVIIICIVSLH